jgi:hypothetical protein
MNFDEEYNELIDNKILMNLNIIIILLYYIII